MPERKPKARTEMSENALPQIEDLWGRAQSTAWHGAGCSCHGPGPVILSAADLEADLLEYLLPRYEKAADLALVDALKTRQANAKGEGFLVWLRGRDIAALPAASRETLLGDVSNSLQSFCEENSAAHAHHH
jgi:hypothetical protein